MSGDPQSVPREIRELFAALARRWYLARRVIEEHNSLGPLRARVISSNMSPDLHENNPGEFIVRIVLVSLFLAFAAVTVTVMLLNNHEDVLTDDFLIDIYLFWVIIFLLSQGIVTFVVKVARLTAYSPTQIRIATLITAVLLSIMLPGEWWPSLPQKIIYEFPLKTRVTMTAPANLVIERDFPSGRTEAYTFEPPQQCKSQVSKIILSIQYRCNGMRTIHGLWYSPQTPCTNCALPSESSRSSDELLQFAFSLSHLNKTKLLPDLERLWPNCLPQNSNAHFWKHEWDKHGSCTGMPLMPYFGLAMDLFNAHASKCPAVKHTRGSTAQDCKLCFTLTQAIQSPHSLKPVLC